MPPYQLLLHLSTLQNLIQYKQELQLSTKKPGSYLKTKIDLLLKEGTSIENITTEQFLQLVLSTKKTICFAESEIVGDGSDWNRSELMILGEISVAMDVKVFDNGVWGAHEETFKTHEPPITARLLFTPGPLLAGHQFRGLTPDFESIVEKGKIDQTKYSTLISQRLLPVLLYASESAKIEGKKALVVLPGIGCGAFAGKFGGKMGEFLNKALQSILEENGAHLKNIACVRFDPFAECEDFERTIQGVSYRVRKNTGPLGRPQLGYVRDYEETGNEFRDCTLYKIVAWDHVSLPGNDYFEGSRNTDDGVTAAATDSMRVITGIEGRYQKGYYLPPEGYQSWNQVARKLKKELVVDENVMVAKPDGTLVNLSNISSLKS